MAEETKEAVSKEDDPRPEKVEQEVKTEEPQEDTSKEVEVPKKFKSLVESIEKLSVLELAELVKILEKKFGVSAAAPVMMSGAGGVSGNGAPEEAKEEKSIVNIELQNSGDKKIEVIKIVRDVTQKGLKEAKDIVDAVASGPQIIKEGVKKEEAEEIKKKLEEAGGKVELK